MSQWAFMHLGIAFMRYVYIFILKNPAHFRNEFWCVFYNLATFVLSVLSEFVLQFLPGKEPLTIYICSGNDPRLYDNQNVKKNHPINLLVSTWLFTYCFTLARIRTYKSKEAKAFASQSLAQIQKNSVFKQISTTSLSNLLVILFCMVIIIGGLLLTIHVNSLHYTQLNVFPNYIIFFFVHHEFPFLILGLFLAIYFYKNKSLRNTVYQEFLALFLDCKEMYQLQI